MFNPMNLFESDILSQPQSMRDALDFYLEQGYFERMAALNKSAYDRFIFTGMGSSYAASLNAGAMLRDAGYCAFNEVTSDLLHYHYNMITERTLMIMVSQSGVSGEAVELCKKMPDQIDIFAITNDPDSTLAKRATEVACMHVENEVTVSTRTYLATQMLSYLFAKAFLGCDKAQVVADLQASIDMLERSLTEFESMRSAIESHIGIPPYLALLGRGWSYSTVDAGALFIREVGKYPSISFESAQFRHGPIELVTKGFAAMVFIPGGCCEDLQVRIVNEIVLHGGKVVVVAQEGVNVPQSESILTIRQQYVSQELAPMVNILPVQAFADYINLAGGYDVSVFRCGSKVTDVE